MSETFTLYKLIILYMLDKVDFPLTNAQISEFILNKGYTTYFKLQQALSALTEAELPQPYPLSSDRRRCPVHPVFQKQYLPLYTRRYRQLFTREKI